MNRKRTLLAVGAMLLLLVAILPTHAAVGAELRQGRLPLNYYWPSFIPQPLVVQPAKSSASETMYNLRLEQPGGGQFDVTISGGAAGEAPGRNGQAVTVRGQRGTAFTTGAGYTVIWSEQGQVYTVSGGLGLRDTLAVADGLEQIDLATFRRRLAAVATRPTIYYVDGGAVFEISADGAARRTTSLASLGGTHDAVDYGLRTLVLSQKGLQSVVPQDGAGVIARFQAGDVRPGSGMLLGTPDNSAVVYHYLRDDKRVLSGLVSVIGIFDSRTLTARKVYGAPGVVEPLGLSRDGRGVYIINRLDGLSIDEITLVSVVDGSVIRRIPVKGWAVAQESPDRGTVALLQCCAGKAAVEGFTGVRLYDLAAPAGTSRLIDVAKVRTQPTIDSLIWSPDSRYIYLKVGRIDQVRAARELLRLNVATGQLERVAAGLSFYGSIVTTDVSGRWLLHRAGSDLDVFDLTTGRSTRVTIPNTAVLLRWR